jgi:hypothetical protein
MGWGFEVLELFILGGLFLPSVAPVSQKDF